MDSEHITQERMILGHLRLHGSITPLQALRLYGSYRLGARIYNLRKKGYNIISQSSRGRAGKHYGKYVLMGK